RPGVRKAAMRVARAGADGLTFALWPWWPAFSLFWLRPITGALAGAKTPAQSIFLALAAGIAVFIALFLSLRRETLTLDLLDGSYRYRRGLWPKLETKEGALSEFKSLALDVLVEPGSKGAEIVTWIISLHLADDATIALTNDGSETLAYRHLADFAKRLNLPVLDRTGPTERVIAPADIDRPLADQERSAPLATSRLFPDPPAGSAIIVSGEAPQRTIILPRSGYRLHYLMAALMPLFPPWWTRTLTKPGFSLPFMIASGLFALIGVVTALTHREIAETADDVTVGRWLFRMPLLRRRYAKREITAIDIKPVPTRGTPRSELQLRTAATVFDIRSVRLSADALAWLAAALRAMVAAS
ncbi:MAG TPA: hypothetical protein VLX85_02855, partial [Stellaceae bacterium]|nr:hypothetical protein [Stellaceae bacterium]